MIIKTNYYIPTGGFWIARHLIWRWAQLPKCYALREKRFRVYRRWKSGTDLAAGWEY